MIATRTGAGTWSAVADKLALHLGSSKIETPLVSDALGSESTIADSDVQVQGISSSVCRFFRPLVEAFESSAV